MKVLTSLRETDWEEKTLELIKEYQNNIDRFRFGEYQAALGETEQAINNLLSLLQDDNFSMRYGAAEALGNIGSRANPK